MMPSALQYRLDRWRVRTRRRRRVEEFLFAAIITALAASAVYYLVDNWQALLVGGGTGVLGVLLLYLTVHDRLSKRKG